MKCPECGRNQRYSDGMVCSCGYRFALNPKREKITDGRLLALAHAASNNDTYYFTENQLKAAYCRREMKSRRAQALFAMLIGFALIAIAWFGVRQAGGSAWLWLTGVGIFLAAVAPWLLATSRPDLSLIEDALRRWHDEGRSLPRLITAPVPHAPPPEWPEPDLYDYGVERILIVERDMLVDLLVKNDFHALARCLVISETGYPDYLAQRAAVLLAEQTDLPAALLHDATPHGVEMIERIRRRGDLPLADRTMLDLGLFPADAERIARLKPLLPGRRDYAVPIDYLSYAMLSSGLAQALDEQLTLAGVLDAQAAGGYETGHFG